MLTLCQDRVVVTSKKVNKKSGKALVHVLFHCISEKKSISKLSFFLLHSAHALVSWRLRNKFFVWHFFVCITSHFSKFTFYFWLLPLIFWQYESRSQTEEKAFWCSQPINRHIFETYFHEIFLIFVYVDTYLI